MNGVCVVGSSKTGTTGLYTSIRAGMEAAGLEPYGMHEKYQERMYRCLELYAPDHPVLAKLLLTNRHFSADVVRHFAQRVHIVRDPRDTLVSVMLYHPIIATNSGAPREQVLSFAAKVSDKELDPKSVSFLDLLIAAYNTNDAGIDAGADFTRRFRLIMNFSEKVESFRVTYEDFVVDDLGPLSDYLGFEVHNAKPIDVKKLVFRSGGSGDWRKWFTPSDVEYFRPLLTPYMERFGYADDWELEPEPVLDPESGSKYIESSTRQRIGQIELNDAKDDMSEERIELLRDRAGDGSATAAFRLVRLLRQQDEQANATEIFQRSLFAARCGNVAAMRSLAECYDRGLGVETDAIASLFWQREADCWSRTDELDERVEQLEKLIQQHRLAAKNAIRELKAADTQTLSERASGVGSRVGRFARAVKARTRAALRAARTALTRG